MFYVHESKGEVACLPLVTMVMRKRIGDRLLNFKRELNSDGHDDDEGGFSRSCIMNEHFKNCSSVKKTLNLGLETPERLKCNLGVTGPVTFQL